MHREPPFGEDFPRNRNISGTIPFSGDPATNGIGNEGLAAPEPRRCRFITAETWEAGTPPPFCGGIAQRGSAYCATHARLCAVDPASPQATRIAFAQKLAARTSPPPALKHLAACAVPDAADDEDSSADPYLGIAIGDDEEDV